MRLNKLGNFSPIDLLVINCDVSHLKNQEIQKEYSDQFQSYLRTSPCTGLSGDVENRWNTIKDGFCKAVQASLKYQVVNKKESINESTLASVEEPTSEKNYSIQNLKGSENESKNLSTPKIRKLRRISHWARELSLIKSVKLCQAFVKFFKPALSTEDSCIPAYFQKPEEKLEHTVGCVADAIRS